MQTGGLTYAEVGATAGSLPAGYHHLRRSATVGHGLADLDEANARGFAYGSLLGHPERGEESFTVTLADDGAVRLTVVAFSTPARWFSRLGAPVTRVVQARIIDKYLTALVAA